MDPDANWEEAVALGKTLLEPEPDTDREEEAMRLAELVVALDEWLRKGGFPPKAFTPDRNKK